MSAKIVLPEKVRKLRQKWILDKQRKRPKYQNSDNKRQKVTLNSTVCQEMPPKTRNRDITHFLNKTA